MPDTANGPSTSAPRNLTDEEVKAIFSTIDDDVRADVANALSGSTIFPENCPSRVYHYTNLDGLLGILKSQQIWATDIRYLNDASEDLYATRAIEEVLTEMGTDNNARPGLTAAINMSRPTTSRAHAACFCQARDLLSQWRAHSAGGTTSYALEFDWGAEGIGATTTPAWTSAHQTEYSCPTSRSTCINLACPDRRKYSLVQANTPRRRDTHYIDTSTKTASHTWRQKTPQSSSAPSAKTRTDRKHLMPVPQKAAAPEPELESGVRRELRGTSVLPDPQHIPDHVYHYTTAEGLLGILKTQCLHATDVRYMNDPSEQLYGDALIQRVIKTFDPDPLLEVIAEVFRVVLQRSNIAAYAACFCERGDLLSQWRAYSSAGTGYALELDWNVMAGPHEGPLPGKVEYETATQEELVEQILKRPFQESLAQMRATMESIRAGATTRRELWPPPEPTKPGPGERHRDPITHALEVIKGPERSGPEFMAAAIQLRVSAAHTVGRSALLRPSVTVGAARYFLKSPAFSEEQEWRLIGWLPPGTSEQFRVKNGIFVPYIEFRAPRRTTLPITKIIIGPSLRPHKAHDSLTRLLAQLKLGHIPVEASRIPIRIL